MLIRSAQESDLPGIIEICNSAIENHFTANPGTSDETCKSYLTPKFKTWLAFGDGEIVGIGVVDMENQNIPELIVKPGQEEYECENKLQEILLDWFYSSRNEDLSLETDGRRQAEEFFLSRGWVRTGISEHGQTRFKMTRKVWEASRLKYEAE